MSKKSKPRELSIVLEDVLLGEIEDGDGKHRSLS